MYTILKKFKHSKGWLVHIRLATSCCNSKRIILEFLQDNEPNEEEIKKCYESRNKRTTL